MHTYDFFGWYANSDFPDRQAPAPANTSTTETPGELRSNWTGYEWVDLPYQVPPAPTAPTVFIPQKCTRRQGRLALLQAGKLGNVEALIAAIPDATQRKAAEIEYEADTWERINPTLQYMWATLGGTESELDALFTLAATL